MKYFVVGAIIFLLGGLGWMIVGIYVDEFIQRVIKKKIPWHMMNLSKQRRKEIMKKGKLK